MWSGSEQWNAGRALHNKKDPLQRQQIQQHTATEKRSDASSQIQNKQSDSQTEQNFILLPLFKNFAADKQGANKKCWNLLWGIRETKQRHTFFYQFTICALCACFDPQKDTTWKPLPKSECWISVKPPMLFGMKNVIINVFRHYCHTKRAKKWRFWRFKSD